MFTRQEWFAWFPVVVTGHGIQRVAWLENVIRERAETQKHTGDWRYYEI